jgi:hypothetical protein
MSHDFETLYYLGYYARVASQARPKKEDEELEFFVLRSRIALGQVDAVISQTQSQSNASQKGVALLAQALKSASPDDVEQLFASRDETLQRTSPNYAVCLAVISLQTEQFARALEILHGVSTPEAVALRIQGYLGLYRIDLAEQELANVGNDVLAKLCRGYIALFKDRDAVQLALNDFQDLNETFGAGVSPLLSNAIAVCHFALGEWEAGYGVVKALSEQVQNETTAINLAVATAHLGKQFEEIKAQVDLARGVPGSQYARKIEELLKDFDDTAARLGTG